MKFQISMVYLDGKEESVECDGYSVRINADVLMQFGTGTTVKWRVENMSQFRSINIGPMETLQ